MFFHHLMFPNILTPRVDRIGAITILKNNADFFVSTGNDYAVLKRFVSQGRHQIVIGQIFIGFPGCWFDKGAAVGPEIVPAVLSELFCRDETGLP